jgi:hypothetical protein
MDAWSTMDAWSRSRILPRASLWKLLKNKLEGSRQWQWDGPAFGHRYQEGLNQPVHRWAKAPASQVVRGGLNEAREVITFMCQKDLNFQSLSHIPATIECV